MTDHIHATSAYGARSIAEEHQAWTIGNTPCIFCGTLPRQARIARALAENDDQPGYDLESAIAAIDAEDIDNEEAGR